MNHHKIKIGIAGVRGLSTVMGFNAMANTEITALCDLDEDVLNREGDNLHIEKKHRYRIFEDMLEADLDAVVIATPMQCHVPQAIAALEAGKHVLSEVTAGVTMDELWWLCETVEKYGKTYMMAENYMYTPQVQLVSELVRRGMFGECYYAEGAYLHNINGLFTYPNGKTSWRSFWQCGKRGAFYPTHSLGPVMQWFPGDHVAEISTFSPGVYNPYGLKQDSGTTTMCRLESGKLAQIRVDCVSPRPHNMTHYLLQGTRGCYQSAQGFGDQDKISFVSETNPDSCMTWQALAEYNQYLPERYLKATAEQAGAGHGGGDFFLVEDFVNAIVTGDAPIVDVYTACEWTAVGLLSELSVVNGGRTMTMPKFRKGAKLEEKIIKL
ncbi:MAG: Gfo/Idh/MocA family oxidoreductase [Ruminococcaceae bacterium]|nr:Gfo/Idh/MocA family oxidoreductase [Oscillospiraceae bacterium]